MHAAALNGFFLGLDLLKLVSTDQVLVLLIKKCSYHQITSIPVCANTAESTSDKWNLSSLDRFWRRHISVLLSH